MDAMTLRILLIGDNATNLNRTSRFIKELAGANSEIVSVKTLRDAQDRLRKENIALVLLAVPSTKGCLADVREAICGLSERAPTVVLTSSDDESDSVTMIEAGAEDVLTISDTGKAQLCRAIRYAVARGKRRASLKADYHRYLLAVEASNDGLWDWNLETNRVYYSPQWAEMLGYNADDIEPTINEWMKRIHPEDVARVQAERDAHLNGQAPYFVTEHRLLHKDGTYRWMLIRGMADHGGNGQATCMAGSLRDISDRKIAEEQLRQGAFYDTLTGLPNRAVLLDRLGRSVEQAKRRGDYLFALLFSDLDGFKVINDSLGHGVGDELLVAVARRLETCVRTVDTVARLGGDEFAIILDDIRDVSDALRVAERIQKSLQEPFELGEHEVVVSGSVGIALSAAGYDTAEEIVRDADIAMYRAKSKGKACHEIFDQTMHAKAADRLGMEQDLRRALEKDNELCVYYQPIISLATNEINGFEALVRWNHPQKGLISPAQFIPVAEEAGLIIPLDRWVLREACRQMAVWHDKFPKTPPLMISVNFSPKQLVQPDLVDQIKAALNDSGLDPASLRPEITESVLMEEVEKATEVMDRLKDMNVLLHMDDFGTGYSSLSYLMRFRVNTLKIDGSFVSHMESGGESVEIVRMIVSLAHNLGMKVIAEGVETEKQLDQLRRLKCQFAQGYYFSKPVPSDQAEALLVSKPAW